MMFRTPLRSQCRPGRLARVSRPIPRPVRIVVTRAENEDDKGKPNKSSGRPAQNNRQIDAALANLRAANPEVAKQVLKAWKEAGVTDAKGVRAQFYKAGLSSVAVASIQTLFDAIATWCALQTAAQFSYADFPLHSIVAYLVYTLSFYFAIGVVLDIFTIGVTITSTLTLGTKADTVYASVTELAGKSSGLSIVDKAQQAVSSGKIILALNSIATALKDGGEEQPSMQTLDRLNALMLLKDAETKFGFSAAKYGMDDNEAAKLALKFSAYDINSDSRLEYSEFKRLCDESEFELTEAEVRVALKMLDTNGDGYVNFDEFAAWWTKSSEDRVAEFKKSNQRAPESTPAK